MNDTWINRKQLSAITGIPYNSIERELLLAGLNPRPDTKAPKPRSNVTEYRYPPDTVEKLKQSVDGRRQK